MPCEHPNIVFIMCDQMRYDCAGFAGHSAARTPALDQMAAEGVRLENAYCGSPVCSPARASWLTGLYPHGHLQLRNYSSSNRGQYGCMLSSQTVTIGDVLHDAGYRCGIVGPWHLGNDADPQHGFNAMWKTHRYQGRPNTDAYINYLRELDLEDTFARDGRPGVKWKTCMGKDNPTLPIDVTALPTEHQRTSWTVDCGIEFVRSQSSPFFLFLSVKDPHPPLLPPAELLGEFPSHRMPVYPSWDDRLEGKPTFLQELPWYAARKFGYAGVQQIVAYYLALIAHIDKQLARLFDALSDAGIWDNTLVVFISDHGEMLGEHGVFGKCLMYEGSVRVPCLLKWPGHLPQGVVLSELVAGVDLMPTLLDLAGVPLSASVHGRSIASDVCAGREPSARPVLSEIASFPGIYDPQSDDRELAHTVMIRDENWKYIRHRSSFDELYDLESDPGELNNLAQDPQQRPLIQRLWATVGTTLRQQGAGPYAWCLE